MTGQSYAKGSYAAEPAAGFGHREVVLESTDDSPSWAPGHADWVCLACGAREDSTNALCLRPCEPKP